MNSAIYKCAFLVLISSFIFSCSHDSNNDLIIYDEVPEVELNYSSFEIEVLDLINNYRKNNNLNSLNTQNIISKEAINHSTYMAKTGEISHNNFPYRHANLTEKLNAINMSENLAFGYITANGVLNAWIASENHKKTIENPMATDFGISIKKDNEGRNYFTLIFIEK